VLSPDELSRFAADGFVAVRGAIPPTVIHACPDIVWSELSARGVRRDDPATWTEPVIRISTPAAAPFVAAAATPPVAEACDQLLGPGRWTATRASVAPRRSAFPARPTPVTPGATGQAGDVFLCHPFLVHAASWPHHGRSPKMMAHPRSSSPTASSQGPPPASSRRPP
jgi:hypothetical protein